MKKVEFKKFIWSLCIPIMFWMFLFGFSTTTFAVTSTPIKAEGFMSHFSRTLTSISEGLGNGLVVFAEGILDGTKEFISNTKEFVHITFSNEKGNSLASANGFLQTEESNNLTNNFVLSGFGIGTQISQDGITKILAPTKKVNNILGTKTSPQEIEVLDSLLLSRIIGIEKAIENLNNNEKRDDNFRQVNSIYDGIRKSVNISSSKITESGTLNNPKIFNPSINNATITNFIATGQGIFAHIPNLPHIFTSWPAGVSNISDSTLYINPSSAVSDSNLLGLAVDGQPKFIVDAEGDIYGKNLILTGSTSSGSTSVGGNLSVQDNTTLGDAPTDTLTINSATGTFANDTNFSLTGGVNGLSFDTDTLSIDSENHRIGIGKTNPLQKLDVAGNINIPSGSAYMYDGGNILFSNTTLYNFFAGGAGNMTMAGDTAIGIGMGALASNTTGYWNVAIGVGSLTNNTIGHRNVAIGRDSLFANTTGERNTAVGSKTLYSNTTGNYNTVSGYYGLWFNTTGYNNTANGAQSLYYLNTGYNNTATGYQSGQNIADGTTRNQTSNNSLYLGYDTRALANGDTNEIVIGASAIGLGSNSVVLGNSSIITTALRGNVGIGTTSPAYKLDVNGAVDSYVTGTGDTSNTSYANFVAQNPYNGYPRASFLIGQNSSDINVALRVAPLFSSAGVQKTSFIDIATNKDSLDAGSLNTVLVQSPTLSYIATSLQGGNLSGGTPIAFSPDQVEAMRILANGRVGIGTTNPVYKLDVNGDINAASGISASGGNASLNFTNVSGAYAGVFTVKNTNPGTASEMSFWTKNLERLRINNDGKVGIGTTSPTFPLDVKYTSSVSSSQFSGINVENLQNDGYSQFRLTNNAGLSGAIVFTGSALNYKQLTPSTLVVSNTNANGIALTSTNTSGKILFYTGGEELTNERMRIDSSGNVGIGTTSPDAILGIKYNGISSAKLLEILSGTGVVRLRVMNNTGKTEHYSGGGINYPSITFDAQTDSGMGVGQGSLSLITDSVARLTVKPTTGNVGIGTTTPEAIVDIATTSNTSLQARRYGYAGEGANLNLWKSNGETIGTNAVLAGGNSVGAINFMAYGGTTYPNSVLASIRAIAAQPTNDANTNLGRLDFTAQMNSNSQVKGFRTLSIMGNTNRVSISGITGNSGEAPSSPSYSLSFNGDAAQTIGLERFSTSDTAGSNFSLSAGGATALATNKTGGDLILSSGISTGTGTSALRFFTTTAGSTGTSDNTPTEKMTILGNGNVGIGNSSPGYTLDVNGGIRAKSTINVISPSGYNILSITGGDDYVAHITHNTPLGGYGTNGMIVFDGGTLYSSNAVQKFVRVLAGMTQTGTAGFTAFEIDTSETSVGSGAKLLLDVKRSGASKFVVNGDGNVGIGTASPATRFSIIGTDSGTGAAGISILKSSSNDSGLFIYNDGGSSNIVSTYLSSGSFTPIQFHTGGGVKMTLNTSGNLGIGTTSPSSPLTVNALGSQIRIETTTDPARFYTTFESLYNAYHPFSLSVGMGGTAVEKIGVYGDAGSGANPRVVIANGNNFGLGTQYPTNVLSIGGNVPRTIWMERNLTAATAGQGLTLSSGGSYSGGTDLAGGDLNLKSGISTGTGDSVIHFFTATAGTTGATDNTPTEKMTILGNGNVGIGTIVPTLGKLEVKSVGDYTTTPFAIAVHAPSQSPYIGGFFNDTKSTTVPIATYFGWDNGDFNMGTLLGKFFLGAGGSLGSGSTTRMTIDNTNGNVGIGTTTPTNITTGWGGSNQLSKLWVADTTSSKYTSIVVAGGDSTTGGGAIQFTTGTGTPVADFGFSNVTGFKEIGIAARDANAAINFYTTPSGTATNRMTILPNGNVGIGKTNPDTKVDINGTLRLSNSTTDAKYYATLNANYNSTHAFNLSVDNNTGLREVIGVYAPAGGGTNLILNPVAGNIGLKTTSPTNLLSLDGTAARTIWMERNTTAATAGQGLTLSSGGAIAGTADLAGGDLNLKSGISTGTGTSALRFFTATAGSTGSTDNTPTEKMTILGNGNVGIGTTGPSTALEVSASIANAPTAIFRNTSNGTFSGIGLYSDSSQANSRNWNLAVNNISWGDFSINQSNARLGDPFLVGTTRLYIGNSGNVGIGTTNPLYKLSVVAPAGYLSSFSDGTAEARFYSWDGGIGLGSIRAGDDWRFFIDNNSQRGLTIKTGTGNVGIGTTSPGAKLHVSTSDANVATFTSSSASNSLTTWNSTTGKNVNFLFQNAGVDKWYVGNIATNDRFYIWDTQERFTILQGGNVGIGATSPSHKLTVGGSDADVQVGDAFSYTPSSSLDLVVGSASQTSRFLFGQGNSTYGGMQWNYSATPANAFLSVGVMNGTNTNGLNILQNGNIGIGTTSPTYALTVGNPTGYMSVGLVTQGLGYGVPTNAGTISDGDKIIFFNAGAKVALGAGAGNDFWFQSSAIAANSALTLYNGATSPVVVFKVLGNGGISSGTDGNTDFSFQGKLLLGSGSSISAPTTTTVADMYLQLGKTEYNVSSNRLIGFGYSGTYSPAYMGFLETSDSGNTNGALVFATRALTTDSTPLERMRIDKDGNVGIGTVSPAAKLNVVDSTAAGSNWYKPLLVYAPNIGTGEHVQVGFGVANSAYNQAEFNFNYVGGTGSTSNTFSLGLHSAADILTMNGSNNVGINNTSPSVALDVTGDIEYTGTITDVSDSRLKENISEITGGESLSIINLLQAKSFNMIGSDKREYGFIAQEVQSVFPDSVSVVDPATGYLGINYLSFTPLMIEAIKEMNLKVDELLSLDTTLENSLGSLVKKFLTDEIITIKEFTTGLLHINGDVCVDDVCITKEEFKQILINAKGETSSGTSTPQADVTPAVPEDTTAVVEPIIVDTNIDTITTEPPVESFPAEEPQISTTNETSVNTMPIDRGVVITP